MPQGTRCTRLPPRLPDLAASAGGRASERRWWRLRCVTHCTSCSGEALPRYEWSWRRRLSTEVKDSRVAFHQVAVTGIAVRRRWRTRTLLHEYCVVAAACPEWGGLEAQ